MYVCACGKDRVTAHKILFEKSQSIVLISYYCSVGMSNATTVHAQIYTHLLAIQSAATARQYSCYIPVVAHSLKQRKQCAHTCKLIKSVASSLQKYQFSSVA